MRYAIIGTRDFPNLGLVAELVHSLPVDSVIVSGGARGPDRVAVEIAEKRGLTTTVYNPTSKSTGRFDTFEAYSRNASVVSEVDCVYAFWDGESNGTRNAINVARSNNIPVFITFPDGVMYTPQDGNKPLSMSRVFDTDVCIGEAETNTVVVFYDADEITNKVARLHLSEEGGAGGKIRLSSFYKTIGNIYISDLLKTAFTINGYSSFVYHYIGEKTKQHSLILVPLSVDYEGNIVTNNDIVSTHISQLKFFLATLAHNMTVGIVLPTMHLQHRSRYYLKSVIRNVFSGYDCPCNIIMYNDCVRSIENSRNAQGRNNGIL